MSNLKPRKRSMGCTLVALAALLVMVVYAIADPSVSNVRASQRAGTKLVDIYYELSGGNPPISVTIQASSDAGATYAVPISSITGDVGANVPAGTNRQITWNAGSDWNGQFSAAVKFKITAGGTPPAPTGMALIPAGSFEMGDALDGMSNSQIHDVYVSVFYMDKYEVTKELWDEVYTWALANGYVFEHTGSGKQSNHPVQVVTWNDCVKWCNARSEKEGLIPCYTLEGSVHKSSLSVPSCDFNKLGYRLPTEAEWEKAARGGLRTCEISRHF